MKEWQQFSNQVLRHSNKILNVLFFYLDKDAQTHGQDDSEKMLRLEILVVVVGVQETNSLLYQRRAGSTCLNFFF